MHNPDGPLSKAQLLVVLRRKDAYGKEVVLDLLRKKYPEKAFPSTMHLKNLTKKEAQDVITGLKPNNPGSGYVRPKGKRRPQKDD